jgi:dolichol-phosphate mannosyltransferase
LKNSLVIIPTYNEKENIARIIPVIFAYTDHAHILVVDDNSPDGTADEVEKMQSENNGRLYLLKRAGKQGLGTAYIAGFRWALERGYDYIFEMDADFSHPPKDLPRLYEACVHGADVAVGSRYAKGGRVVHWPLSRILISYCASLYVRSITWISVKDTTAGFICYKKKVLETIDLDSIRFIGYAFQIEMKYAAWKLGFRIVEVPIVFEDRKAGESKMSTRIFSEAFTGVWKMRKLSYTKKN